VRGDDLDELDEFKAGLGRGVSTGIKLAILRPHGGDEDVTPD
jgi:hypothetical protein